MTIFLIIFAAGISPAAHPNSSVDRSKVAIDVIELDGSRLPEVIQHQLVTSLKQREWDESSNWVADLEGLVVSAETEGWPDRENQGYLGFSVSAEWKPLRREPGLVHVRVTVHVDEGQQKRLKKIALSHVGVRSGPPILDPDDLRKLIPLNDGEIYNRDKYYVGLSAVTNAHAERGFIDCTINQTMKSNDVDQTVALVVDITEGPQYRWRNIQVLGLAPRLEKILRTRVTTGGLANSKLIRDFYQEYKFLLPAGASPETVKWVRDGQHATVDLIFNFNTPKTPSVHD